jgi:hypothetical protein
MAAAVARLLVSGSSEGGTRRVKPLATTSVERAMGGIDRDSPSAVGVFPDFDVAAAACRKLGELGVLAVLTR